MDKNLADKIRSANIDVHTREAGLYDAIHPEIFGAHEQLKIRRDLDRIAALVRPDTQVQALDLGCGTGNLTLKYLAHRWRVTAVDISVEMINILRAKVPAQAEPRIDYIVGDAEAVLANARSHAAWDVISFSSVLHHLPDYLRVLTLAVQQLRPQGVLYVCHEPLKKYDVQAGALARIIDNAFGVVDDVFVRARKMGVYLARIAKTRQPLQRIDYAWSDYHVQTGIDLQEVTRTLEAAGAEMVSVETYRSRYSSFLARLDETRRVSRSSHFRLIARQASAESHG